MSKVIKFTGYSNRPETRVIARRWFVQNIEAQTDTELEESMDPNQQVEESPLVIGAKELATKIIEEARVEAEELREAIAKEIEERRKEERERVERLKEELFQEARQHGFQQGYEDGLKAGRLDGQREFAALIEEAAGWILRAKEDWHKKMRESEPYLLELAVAIAEKIILREINRKDDTILSMVKETLRNSSELKEITVCVHPEHYNLIKAAEQELKQLVSSQANVIIVPDLSITNGGCVIRTTLGSLDARIDTQLEEIKMALLEAAKGCADHEFSSTSNL